MSILQTVIASISVGGEAPPPPPPSFNPIDSGVSLGLNWTVEIIASFAPTGFWATMWGNESWNAGLGHLAYFGGSNFLSVGAPNAGNEYTLTDDIATKAYWVFTHSDGGGIDVYRNGVLLTPTATNYVQPSGLAGNTLLYGARHGNDGTGTADTIGSASYFYTDISSQAQTSAWVTASYDNFKVSYGL